MEIFSHWLKSEGFDFPTQAMPQPNLSPETGKGGLSDDSSLPMGMRRPAITSAFQTYSMPQSRRAFGKRDKKLP